MNQNSRINDLKAKADEGNAEAQFMLGEFYNSEEGVTVHEIANWYLKAANQNHAKAQLALGLLYLEWLPDEDYREKAFYWIEKAVERGCEHALKVLIELGPKDDYMDGCDLLAAVEDGDPEAQHELGSRLLFGVDGPKDESAGLNLLFRAAIAGLPKAQMYIGSHYLFGTHGVADAAEAIKWLSLSARQNDHFALYFLGYCYYEGIGVIKKDEQAAAFLLRSAKMGNSDAQYHLAGFYHDGIGVTANQEQEEAWCREAALQDNEKAKEMLRYLHEVWEGEK